MSWRHIQDIAIVSLSIMLGTLVIVAILALLGYLVMQGYACVQEWRAPKSFIELVGVYRLIDLVLAIAMGIAMCVMLGLRLLD